MTTTVAALIDSRPEGGWYVRSPQVGIYRGRPHVGSRRGAGEPVGTLAILNRAHDVILPVGVEGIVTDVAINDRAVSVEYGQTLFTLIPDAGAADSTEAPRPASPSGDSGLPQGTLPVICPIDGIFYRRSAPGSAPFVAVGETIETGRTLGLIEAMKSFNAVAYGGPGLPERAVITEIRAADAGEVRQGAVLVVVRPA